MFVRGVPIDRDSSYRGLARLRLAQLRADQGSYEVLGGLPSSDEVLGDGHPMVGCETQDALDRAACDARCRGIQDHLLREGCFDLQRHL